MGGGKKIPYPKHVWSPSGGWYAQPANWKANTAIALAAMFGLTVLTWRYSASIEQRSKMPHPDSFHPSRYWAKEIIEHEKKQKAKAEREQAQKSST